jgi:hypothetical protein
MIITIRRGGTALMLAEDASFLSRVGPVCRERYSHIWPRSFALRAAFRFLRGLTSERGVISNWTRTWQCVWEVRLAASPSVVRHTGTRSECIEWEKANLDKTL